MQDNNPVQRWSADDYGALILSLLPQGPLWPRDADGKLALLCAALGAELARLHNRVCDLIEIERDPRRAYETLADWEDFAGLPDPCAGDEQSLDGRRRRLVATLTARGGASPGYFIDLASRLGYDVGVREYRPLRCGHPARAWLWGEPAAYDWTVRAPLVSIEVLRCGHGSGERLRRWGNQPLECNIARRAPAHTHVGFAYIAPYCGGPLGAPAVAMLGGGVLADESEWVVGGGSL